jgi:hypothetical protein
MPVPTGNEGCLPRCHTHSRRDALFGLKICSNPVKSQPHQPFTSDSILLFLAENVIFYDSVETLYSHNNSRQLFIYAKKSLKASFLIKIVWGMLKNKTI